MDGPGIHWLIFIDPRNDSGDILKSKLSTGLKGCWSWLVAGGLGLVPLGFDVGCVVG